MDIISRMDTFIEATDNQRFFDIFLSKQQHERVVK